MRLVPSLRSGFRLRAPARHDELTPAKRLNLESEVKEPRR